MKKQTNRLLLIDLAKGVAILIMVGLHYLYVLYELQIIDQSSIRSVPYVVASRIVAVSFILLSTVLLWQRSQSIISSKLWFSSLAKQVVKLSLAALLVTIATSIWIEDTFVRFGMLHLLAVSTLVNGVLFRFHLPRWWFLGFGLFVLLFGNWLSLFTFPVVGWEWLGLKSTSFQSVDYVPVLPWLGVTWLSVLVAPRLIQLAQQQQDYLEATANLSWLYYAGKHTLAIYLLHVPLLLASIWLISNFL